MFSYDFLMRKIIQIGLLFFIISANSYAASLIGRLGIGASNQLTTGMDVISFKLQRNRSSAMGGVFGLDSSSEGMNYALGLKGYKYIYEEPQLNFYSSLAGYIFTYEDENNDTKQGYQVDGTFGAEFSFQGLESIGFSFEFGLGMHKYRETHFKTIGYNVIASAIHFYL